jgi:hypothetical protein
MKKFLITCFLAEIMCLSMPAVAAEKPTPFADIHLHFNWDQEELVSAEQALASLRKHNVVFAVAFSTPSANVLKLSGISEGRVIPFFSPYITGHSRSNWFNDKRVLLLARKGLEEGTYKGIGEVHIISGIGPRRDNEIFQGLLNLAAEFNVPVNIHTETSNFKFLKPICQNHPDVRFLWAHAGGMLGPEHSEGIIKACPNIWIELSARDTHHYGGLIEANGKLRSAWKALFIKYPERFMVGTDPVWHAHQVNRWYEADEGWLHYDKFISFHRGWLAELPADVEKKIRLENALQFFKIQAAL